MSKNAISLEHIELACRHVQELMAAGVTENLAIRTLEHFCDVYAKLKSGGSATPHHASQVELWSIEALRLVAANPSLKPADHLRVEHGTPRRQFARLVRALYQGGKLDGETLDGLVTRHWRLAVITREEDARLNQAYRSKLFDTPEERWAAAGIKFPAAKAPAQ